MNNDLSINITVNTDISKLTTVKNEFETLSTPIKNFSTIMVELAINLVGQLFCDTFLIRRNTMRKISLAPCV
jgi:hypothetical protein